MRLETSSENGNVKLRLKTKKMDSSRLENTQLCEDSANCHSKSDELSSSSSSVKVIVETEESLENDKNVSKEELNNTMGLKQLSLADRNLEKLKVDSRVRTRSMSRKRNGPKT